MIPFLYRCPTTKLRVQGWSETDVSKDDAERVEYESVTCLACGRVHLVDPRTGKVLGEDDDE